MTTPIKTPNLEVQVEMKFVRTVTLSPPNASFEEELENQRTLIKQLFAEITDEDFDAVFESGIKPFLACDDFAGAMSDLWFKQIKKPDFAPEVVLASAWCNTTKAEQLHLEGEIDSAWELLYKGISQAKDVRAQKAALEAEIESRPARMKALISEGQAACHKRKNRPVVEEACRLMHSKRPPGGWKNKTDAITGISDALQTFIKHVGSKLSLDNIFNTLMKWLRSDTDLQKAFEETRLQRPAI